MYKLWLNRLFIALLGLFIFSAGVKAQTANFLPGGRAKGYGGAYLAQADDPWAILWNPANLGDLKRSLMGINIQQFYTFDSITLTSYIPGVGGLGVGVFQRSFASENRELLLLGWGRAIRPSLLIGMNLNLMRFEKTLDPQLNLGLTYLLYPSLPWFLEGTLRFSITLHNVDLGQRNLGDELLGGFGMSYQGFGKFFQLAFSFLTGKRTRDYRLGAELRTSPYVAFRAGSINFQSDRIYYGLGLHIRDLQIDLAYDLKRRRVGFSTVVAFGTKPKVRAAAYYRQGLEAVKEDHLRRARSLYSKALELDPHNAKYKRVYRRVQAKLYQKEKLAKKLFAEAEAFKRQGFFLSASIRYLKVLDFDPENKKAREELLKIRPYLNYDLRRIFLKGVEFFKEGDYLTAKKIFEQIMLANGNFKEVKFYFDQVTKILQKQSEDYYYQGLGYYSQRKWERAEEAFRKALTYNPDHWEAARYLNEVRRKIKEVRAQIQKKLTLARQAEQENSYIWALKLYSEILDLDEKHPEALSALQRLRPKVNRYVSRQLDYGLKALRSQQYEKARKYFENVLRIIPDHPVAKNSLRRIKERQKAEVERLYKVGLEYFNRGEWEKAIENFKKALVISPNEEGIRAKMEEALAQWDIKKLLGKGIRHFQRKEYKKAMGYFQQVLNIQPMHTLATEYLERTQMALREQVKHYLRLGVRHYSEEEYYSALDMFNKVLELDPSNKSAQEYKSRIQKKLAALRKLP